MAIVVGTLGNDLPPVLNGTAFNDVIIGLDGNDSLNFGPLGLGLGGSDIMIGGDGNDTYTVNSLQDRIFEGFNEGFDTIRSTINFSLNQFLSFQGVQNVENLTLIGPAIVGTGNALRNILNGNGFANTLSGLGGNDTVNGAGGSDALIGGFGADRLTGGLGADRFDYNFTNESFGVFGTDFITDFSQLQGDRIDVSTIDANAALFGNQTFTFRGQLGFTGAGQLRYQIIGGDTFVFGNTDADLLPEFTIRVDPVINFNAGNFIL